MAETGRWSAYYITKAGRELRQRCIAEGVKVVFTRAAIGEGMPTDPTEISGMSELVSYARDVTIKKSYALDVNHLCIVRVDNSGYTEGVLMTEVGVYARGEDQTVSEAILYGYAYNTSGYVDIPPQTSQTNRKIFEITLDTYLGLSTEIEIIYDGSTLFVSHADLDDYAEGVEAALANKANVGRIEEYMLECTEGCNPYVHSEYGAGLNTYSIDPFGRVNINLAVLASDETVGLKHGMVLAVLPEGFRPSKTCAFPAIFANSNVRYACNVDINPSGHILMSVDSKVSEGKLALSCIAFCGFVAAQ